MAEMMRYTITGPDYLKVIRVLDMARKFKRECYTGTDGALWHPVFVELADAIDALDAKPRRYFVVGCQVHGIGYMPTVAQCATREDAERIAAALNARDENARA